MSGFEYSHNPMFGLKHHQLEVGEVYDILRPGYSVYTMGMYKGKKNGKLQFYNNRPARHTTYEVEPKDNLHFKLKRKGDPWINISMKGGEHKVAYAASESNQANLNTVLGFKKHNSNILMKLPTVTAAKKKIEDYILRMGLFYEDIAFLKRNGMTLTDFMIRLYKAYEAGHTGICSISHEDNKFVAEHRRLLDGPIQINIMDYILGATGQYNLGKYNPKWFEYYKEECQAGGGKTRKRLRKRGTRRR